MGRAAMAAVAVAAFAAFAGGAGAGGPTCDTSWAGAVSGSWSDLANWTAGVPTSATQACITLAGTYTVSVRGSANVAGGITLGGSSGTQTLELAGDAGNGFAELVLSSQGSGSSGVLAHGVVQLSNQDAGTYPLLNVTGGTLTNAGTIQSLPGTAVGGGRLLYGNLDNQGLLAVSASLDEDTGGSESWTTSGTITIAAGQRLFFSAGDFSQTGGTITNSGTFLQDSGTFTASAGTATGNALGLKNVTIVPTGTGSGVFTVFASSTLGGDIAPGYTVRVAGQTLSATLNVTADRTNNGTLTLDNDNAGSNAFLNISAGKTLTNAGAMSVEVGAGLGSGRFVAGALSNAGTLTLNEQLQLQSGATLTNTGTTDVTAGNELLIKSGASMVQTSPGTTTGTGAITVNGALSGVGTIAPAVTSNGTISPGSSPGILTLSGNYTQGSTGHLQIEIAGATPGTQYDRLAVGGTATLDGALDVTTTGSQTGSFQVLTATGGRSGTFASVNVTGQSYTTQYNADNVTLVSQTTAVRVTSCTARRSGRSVVVRWRVGADAGILGYELYRGRTRLSRSLILAGGSSYSFRDLHPGAHPRYALYAVGLDGRRVLVARA